MPLKRTAGGTEMKDDYYKFLQSKAPKTIMRGLSRAPALSSHLFGYQADCVRFNLECGGSGLYLDTGLGKTLCQLEYLAHAAEATNGRALLLTPLAVAGQIVREGLKFGYKVRQIRSQDDAGEGINVCNYDRLHLVNPETFGAVSLDESSILKSFTGKTTRALINAFEGHRFKLSATATPAPNDHMELGQQSEFCGVMPQTDMLIRWFINDTADTGTWRLKGHAINSFWDWIASWARMAQMPSDLGHSDEGFVLPKIKSHRHMVDAAPVAMEGDLFGVSQVSATNLHTIKRITSRGRADLAVELAMAEPSEPFVIWVDTDYEADAVWDAVGNAEGVVEVRGSMSAEVKERAIEQFSDGTARVMICKPSSCGFGLNWQHCARTVFVAMSPGIRLSADSGGSAKSVKCIAI
jgi:hypothetical protein